MTVKWPRMREELINALEALSDPEYQQRVWVDQIYPSPDYYDELDWQIHILFDDIDVGVDPDKWVGGVIHPAEVEPLRALGHCFQGVIDDLGDASDADYLADPRWPEVVRLSRIALETMRLTP